MKQEQVLLVLKDMGLTDSEQKVYLALLGLGDSTRSAIVKESKIAGSKLYDVIDRLVDKGLVSSFIQNNTKHFKATDPRNLLKYLEKKKQHIIDLETQTNLILPALLVRFSDTKEEQEVELLSGHEGLETVFRDQVSALKKGDSCYVIGGTRGNDEGAVLAFFEKIHIMREENGIKTQMLFNERQRTSTSDHYATKKFPLTTTRFIAHTSPVAINIYANITVIIIFSKKISAIRIVSDDVAQSFKEYFKMLWNIGKP